MKSFFFVRGAEPAMSHNEKLKAFEALAFEHMDAIYRAAWRMTRNRLDAEDLVQEVYLRAFRFFDYFQTGSNFKAWLFTILRNTFINHYRQHKKQPAMLPFDKVAFTLSNTDERMPRPQDTDRYDGINYRDMFTDPIYAALDRLSDEFRMVVLLADIEEFQYHEIAEIMNCPIGTVMSRLSRARRQLQRYLRDYANREGYIGKTVMNKKPTSTGETRGRIRHAVAAAVFLLAFVLFGRPAAAQIDLSENIGITQPLLSVNVLYFRAGNEAKTRTDVFVEIPYSKLTFVKSGAEYKAKVEARVVFDDASGFQVGGNTITDTIRTDDFQVTLSSSRKNLFYFPFQIVPGRYSLRVSVIDEYTGGLTETAHKISVPSFQNPLLQISSLKLARDVDMFPTDSALQKSGRDLAPNVPHLFASNLPYFIYFEAYHLEPAAPPADSFQVYCCILRNDKEMRSSIHHYPKPGAHVGITTKLNLRNLKSGLYVLKVTVTDLNGKRRAEAVAQFYIIDALYEFSNNQNGRIAGQLNQIN